MKVEIIVALVGLFGVLITTIVNTIVVSKKLNSELDFITGWRKDLSRIAGESEVSLEDVYIVRAKLRFSKKEENSEYVKVMNYIIDELENILEKAEVKLSEKSQKKIRLICMYLLKIQWENREYMLPRKPYFRRLFPLKIRTYCDGFYTEIKKIEENTEEKSMNKENKDNTESISDKEPSNNKNNCWNYVVCHCVLVKLLIFLIIIMGIPAILIKFLELNQGWKDIVIILLVGLFSLFYILIEKE